MNIVSECLWTIFSFLLPQRCLACGREIETGFLCNNCYDYLPVAHSPRCRWCGRTTKKKDICTLCKQGTHLVHGRSWLLFVPPVDVIIHAFKYRRMSNLSRLLGQGMATVVRSDQVLKDADLVTPVPLFWWKRMHRTYNQATLLSNVISKECHIPHAELLRRDRYTRTQTRLDNAARRKNVASAFSVKKNAVQDKSILLVDDVMTTGATMNECARTLKAAGAREVYSCVAAITPE